MHADCVGHSLQIQGPQIGDAVDEEEVLLAHDFTGNLEDGARPLIQALHEPAGILAALGDEAALRLIAGSRVDFIVVPVVDEHARQGFRVELDMPAPIGGLADIDIGFDGAG